MLPASPSEEGMPHMDANNANKSTEVTLSYLSCLNQYADVKSMHKIV